jgi:Na+-transporting methylmalonyl-CoA/oxaloacetate decarboxylase gamma subunit
VGARGVSIFAFLIGFILVACREKMSECEREAYLKDKKNKAKEKMKEKTKEKLKEMRQVS